VTPSIVHKQHVVSKVVLRRFALPNERLIVHHFNPPFAATEKPISGQAYVDDYIAVDSAQSEARWKTIEDRAHIIYRMMDNGMIGTPEWRTAATPLALELISLHAVRSRATLQHWLNIAPVLAWEKAREAWHPNGELMEALLREKGLVRLPLAQRMVLEADFANDLYNRMTAQGEHFRDHVHNIQTKFSNFLQDKTIEVGIAPEGKEFLIGDAPATVRDTVTGKYGIFEGVGLTGGDELLFPLDRRHVVGVMGASRQPRSLILTPDGVDQINLLQLRASFSRVFYHPESGLTPWVNEMVANRWKAINK
jgi:hypothetical protein